MSGLLRRLGQRKDAAYLVVVVMTLLAAVVTSCSSPIFVDEREYWTIAENLVWRGMLSVDGRAPSAFRPPVIPWLLFPFVRLGLDLRLAKIACVVFYALSGVILLRYLMSLGMRDSRLPALGATLLLANPAYVSLSGTLHPQTVQTPALMLIFAGCFSDIDSHRSAVLRAVTIGLGSAVALLAAASAVFVLVPVYLCLLARDVRARPPQRPYRYSAALSFAVLCLALAPYFYRNHAAVHPGLYLSLNSGENLLLGNSPFTRANSGPEIVQEAVEPWRLDLPEYELNQHYTAVAVRNMRNEPQRYARLYVLKFLNSFNNSATTAAFGASPAKTVVLWTYMLILWGGWLAFVIVMHGHRVVAERFLARRLLAPLRGLGLLVSVSYVANVAGYAVFFTKVRFRIPLDAALTLIASIGVYVVLCAMQERWGKGCADAR